MKRSKTLIAVLAGSLLLGGTGAALAIGKGGCDRGGNPMRAVMQLDNLTEAQRSQLDSLRQEQREAMRQQMEGAREARRELHEAMAQGADAATLRPLAEKQGARVTAMILARAEARQQVEAILTPEQREQLKQQRAQRSKERGERGHPRHGW